MPPQNSSSFSGVVNEDKYEDLTKELDVYTTLGNAAIFGDLMCIRRLEMQLHSEIWIVVSGLNKKGI